VSGLTAIVPCYNEGAQVDLAYREVCEALGTVDDLELLFIDDGSRDDTLERIRRIAAADPRVHYVSFARNFGLPAAVTAGFRYAARPWAVQLDADMQFPAAETWKLLDTASEGYDVVFGVRADRKDSALRRLGAAGAHWVARKVLKVEVPQGATSFRVVRTEVGRTVVNLPTGNSHFVAKAPHVGARCAMVPVAHRERSAGTSKFRIGRLAGDAFELWFGFSWRPLNAVYLLAALAAFAAVLLSVLGILGAVGGTALLVTALLVSASATVGVAVVGRYLFRRMMDVRPRRIYYVREANIPVSDEDMLDRGVPAPPPPRRASGVASVVR
jgi:glycosyltransferase involved in cell wall biosynthesis